jgi:hypothetical protein
VVRTERNERIISDYRNGDTLAVLSARHGLTGEGVRRVLIAHGVELRRPGKPVTGPPEVKAKAADKYARKRAKTLLRKAIIRLDARVDAIVAAAEPPSESEPVRPALSPELEQRLQEAEQEIARRNTPAPEPPPDPNAGLDPADPKPWPCEIEWMQRHFPNGVPASMAQQLTDSYHLLMRYGVPRGSDAYFIALELRCGIGKPTRRKKNV